MDKLDSSDIDVGCFTNMNQYELTRDPLLFSLGKRGLPMVFANAVLDSMRIHPPIRFNTRVSI